MADDRKIKVLVVDDSQVAQMLLVHILDDDPQIRVIGAVQDGRSALDFVGKNKPDVVLMDINMPGMDGFEATRLIMETSPVPIVVCSATSSPDDVATTFRVMEAGAVACVEKPRGRGHADFELMAASLRQTVRAMSEVKVVRRWAHNRPPPVPEPAPVRDARNPAAEPRVVGIGASTGGPQVLQEILAGLPTTFPAPVLIVQHIAPGFLPGLADWLNQTTGWGSHIASHGMSPKPGHAYLAPDDFHMGLGGGGRILLSKAGAQHHLRPSVSHLFRSLAQVCGPAAVGVLLSGMGKDGAAELRLMRDAGAITIAQDFDTSIVHGMPGEAIRLGGATYVCAADDIANRLLATVAGRTRSLETPS